jgi:type IV fimbrial biogenesis protein FimT
MNKNTGFTLIELIITMLIVGILLTVGIPSLQDFLRGNQLVASTNELLSALHVARSEAIKLNTRVSVCDSTNGTSCAGTGEWEKGWIVFADSNGDLVSTGTLCTAVNTDCLLRVQAKVDDSSTTIRGLDSNSAAMTSLTFTSRGLPKTMAGASQSGNLSICTKDSDGNALSRAVVLSLSGRVRVSDNAAVITCP